MPEVAGKLVDAGFEVLVQAGAGAEAHLPDDAYSEKGATLVAAAGDVLGQGDVVLKVAAPEQSELGQMREGAAVPAAVINIGKNLPRRRAPASVAR